MSHRGGRRGVLGKCTYITRSGAEVRTSLYSYLSQGGSIPAQSMPTGPQKMLPRSMDAQPGKQLLAASEAGRDGNWGLLGVIRKGGGNFPLRGRGWRGKERRGDWQGKRKRDLSMRKDCAHHLWHGPPLCLCKQV